MTQPLDPLPLEALIIRGTYVMCKGSEVLRSSFVHAGKNLVRTCARLAEELTGPGLMTATVGQFDSYQQEAKAVVEILSDERLPNLVRVDILRENPSYVARLATVKEVSAIQRREIERLVLIAETLGSEQGTRLERSSRNGHLMYIVSTMDSLLTGPNADKWEATIDAMLSDAIGLMIDNRRLALTNAQYLGDLMYFRKWSAETTLSAISLFVAHDCFNYILGARRHYESEPAMLERIDQFAASSIMFLEGRKEREILELITSGKQTPQNLRIIAEAALARLGQERLPQPGGAGPAGLRRCRC